MGRKKIIKTVKDISEEKKEIELSNSFSSHYDSVPIEHIELPKSKKQKKINLEPKIKKQKVLPVEKPVEKPVEVLIEVQKEKHKPKPKKQKKNILIEDVEEEITMDDIDAYVKQEVKKRLENIQLSTPTNSKNDFFFPKNQAQPQIQQETSILKTIQNNALNLGISMAFPILYRLLMKGLNGRIENSQIQEQKHVQLSESQKSTVLGHLGI